MASATKVIESSLMVAGRTPTVALLRLPARIQQCISAPFIADIDRAERGLSSPVIDLNNMKRATAAKDNASPPSLAGNPESSTSTATKEQATTTGANRYAKDPHLTNPTVDPHLTNPTASSSTQSQDNEIPSGEGKTAKNERRPSQKAPGTAYNERIIDKSYESYPLGLPRLAAFLNSAESFAIARRFGTVHSRVLLHLECEITALEKQLDDLDEDDFNNPETKYRLRRVEHHEGWDPAQKELIDTLKLKLLEYDALLLNDNSLRALTPAPLNDHRSVFNWIYNKKPLDLGQYNFIYQRDDFVSLGKQPQNGFDGFIRSCLNRWPNSRFQRFLRHEDKNQVKQDKHVFLFSSEKISLVAKIMAVCVSVSVLLIPIFLLFLTQMSRKITAIIVLVFVLAFATLMSLFTGAKAESVFIGTCTYCAVLVTFLGNLKGAGVAVGSS